MQPRRLSVSVTARKRTTSVDWIIAHVPEKRNGRGKATEKKVHHVACGLKSSYMPQIIWAIVTKRREVKKWEETYADT